MDNQSMLVKIIYISNVEGNCCEMEDEYESNPSDVTHRSPNGMVFISTGKNWCIWLGHLSVNRPLKRNDKLQITHQCFIPNLICLPVI